MMMFENWKHDVMRVCLGPRASRNRMQLPRQASLLPSRLRHVGYIFTSRIALMQHCEHCLDARDWEC
jgi:hypothetical protein